MLGVVSLVGCASNSGIVTVGPDSYFVSRQAATGFSGMSSLKAEALTEAGQFCTGMGKNVEVTSENDTKPPYILGNFPRTEIRFKCLPRSLAN